MKRVLVNSSYNSVRGPMALACLEKFKKCKVELRATGLEQKNLHPKTAEALAFDGMQALQSLPGTEEELTETEFDYVITVCDQARDNLPKLKGNPLFFHYHFRDLNAEHDLAEFIELRNTIKQYFERFCKMYLNEFS